MASYEAIYKVVKFDTNVSDYLAQEDRNKVLMGVLMGRPIERIDPYSSDIPRQLGMTYPLSYNTFLEDVLYRLMDRYPTFLLDKLLK